MATLEIPSNVKCITSGQVPTTANLKDGEFAFGKVGGVAKLYGNVNGVIIDFTGDSGGTIDVDTLNGLLSGGNNISINKVVTAKRSEFVEVKTTPSPTFDDVTLNKTLILGEDTAESYTSIIESPAHSHDVTFRFTYGQTEDVKLSEFVKSTGLKTLFNNQSIVGSGNITLYRHFVQCSNSDDVNTATNLIYFEFYSHLNNPIQSLTDLFTYMPGRHVASGFIGAHGRYYGPVIATLNTRTGLIMFADASTDFSTFKTIKLADAGITTVVDTVTLM